MDFVRGRTVTADGRRQTADGRRSTTADGRRSTVDGGGRQTTAYTELMLTLRAALGDYRHTSPLRDGRVSSPQLGFEFADIVPVNRAFRPMVNDLAFDVSE